MCASSLLARNGVRIFFFVLEKKEGIRASATVNASRCSRTLTLRCGVRCRCVTRKKLRLGYKELLRASP